MDVNPLQHGLNVDHLKIKKQVPPPHVCISSPSISRKILVKWKE